MQENKIGFSCMATESEQKVRPIKWLLKGLIEQGSLNMMFGPSGEKKSFVAIDMALHLVNNKDWNGYKVKQDVEVLYIAGEGKNGLNLRINAACKEHSLSNKGLWLSNSSIDLNLPATSTEMSTLCTNIEAQMSKTGKSVLVIVDTLNRNFSGEENSAKDMGRLWQNLDSIRVLGASVLLVHHTGHGTKDRARGSSSMKAAMDGEISVSTDTNNVTWVRNTKNKNSASTNSIVMEGKVIDFGVDEDGDRITSLAMIKTKATEKASIDDVVLAINTIIDIEPTHKEIDVLGAEMLLTTEANFSKNYKTKILELLVNEHAVEVVRKQWRRVKTYDYLPKGFTIKQVIDVLHEHTSTAVTGKYGLHFQLSNIFKITKSDASTLMSKLHTDKLISLAKSGKYTIK